MKTDTTEPVGSIFVIVMGSLLQLIAFTNLTVGGYLVALILFLVGSALQLWGLAGWEEYKNEKRYRDNHERWERERKAEEAFATWGERVDAARSTRAAEGRERLDSQCK